MPIYQAFETFPSLPSPRLKKVGGFLRRQQNLSQTGGYRDSLMTRIEPEGEFVEFKCPHCGNPVRQNLRRLEAGVTDPLCLFCSVRVKLSNEDRARIISDHRHWFLTRPRSPAKASEKQ